MMGSPFFVSMRSTHHARLFIIGSKPLLQSCLSQRTDMQRPFSNPFSQRRRKSLQVGQDKLFLVCQPHLYLSTNSLGLKLTFKLTVNVEAIRSNGIRSISLFSTVLARWPSVKEKKKKHFWGVILSRIVSLCGPCVAESYWCQPHLRVPSGLVHTSGKPGHGAF